MSDFLCFAGQVCVVTGAGSENGNKAAARQLIGREAGELIHELDVFPVLNIYKGNDALLM